MSIVAGPVRFSRLDADGQPTGDAFDALAAEVTLSMVEEESTETVFVLEPAEISFTTRVDLLENHRLRWLLGFVLTARGRRLRRYRRMLARQTSQTRRNKHGRKGVRA